MLILFCVVSVEGRRLIVIFSAEVIFTKNSVGQSQASRGFDDGDNQEGVRW